ncbi:MAG: LysR family transcriptional regulator [Spirochaetaceae bacterium]|jgi:lysyl-tRNA synthetase class 2|nr:LysR family transcriptional regulator [Spirochaetaceae bacterium]
MDIETLEKRARVIQGTRAFFDERAYLETDTPLLAPRLIPETCLELFGTRRLAPEGSARESRDYWLIPSPELWMKKLIAAHRRNIYQICRCFRNGESSGHLHSPEFTMLEYYTMNAGYLESLALTEELFDFLLDRDPAQEALRPPFLRVSMDEAFRRWAGFSLMEAESREALAAEAQRLGITAGPELSMETLFNLIFIHQVEPRLPKEKPVVLMDYPAFVPCLAKKKKEGNVVERWELYVNGVELANCYSEETDPEEVRTYFEREGALKTKNALVPHDIDHDYWKIFLPRTGPDGEARPFPRCSGSALGMDRLIMVLEGKSVIDSVLPFPM